MYFYPQFCYDKSMSFKTILEGSSHQIIVQQSKFICHLFPVKTVEAAEAAIASVCKEHYKATHNVPAYIVGDEYKYSDDGEPGGTAGAPSFLVLKNEGFDYICAVVTRYFGGIKLGTGGLSRAYTAAVKEALLQTRIVTVSEFDRTEIEIDYTNLGSVEYYLMNLSEDGKVHIANKEYLEKVILTLYSAPGLTERMLAEITEITAAKAKIVRLPSLYLTDDFQIF